MFKKTLQTVRSQILSNSLSAISLKNARSFSFVKSSNIFDTLKGANYLQGSQLNFTSSLQREKIYNTCFTQCRRFSGAPEKVIKVPPMGDAVPEGTLGKWQKKPGDFVQTDEVIAIIETDKVNQEVRAQEPGQIKELLAKEGDTVRAGADLIKFVPGEVPKAAKATPPPAPASSTPSSKQESAPKATPAPSTAPPKASPPPPSSSQTSTPKKETPAPSATSTVGGSRTEYSQKMSRMRQRIAERLKGAQNTYAMLTTFQEADMSNLMALRDTYKDEFQEKHGVKLGFMSAFVKASATALQEQPVVNAVIDKDEILYRDYIDISVAVATPTGLVVPVLRNADKMSFADIEKTIAALGKKARDGQLSIEDMAGGTFTISNGGVYGSMMGTPIINPPQSAILGMHAITKRAVVVNDQVVVRPMMYLALTYDHRLIDGKEAVTFLRKIKHVIEDPRRLLLDV